MSANDQRSDVDRISELVSISADDAIAVLTTRIGELERQNIINGVIISRLTSRIIAIDPEDRLVRDIKVGDPHVQHSAGDLHSNRNGDSVPGGPGN